MLNQNFLLDIFRKHFEIAKERNDEILCGLAIGNLGNAHFYLGDYEQSIIYHLKVILNKIFFLQIKLKK